MRMILLRFAGLLAMMPMLAAPAQAAPAFQEGEWAITTQTEISGMPFTPPAITMRQCLTIKDRIPQGKDASGNCKVTDVSSSGDTVQWTMRCSDTNGTTKAKGEVTYSGKTMKGVSHITSSSRGETMQMTSRMKGHRIGPCQ